MILRSMVCSQLIRRMLPRPIGWISEMGMGRSSPSLSLLSVLFVRLQHGDLAGQDHRGTTVEDTRTKVHPSRQMKTHVLMKK